MLEKPMEGVCPILVTPFDESGDVDEASLRNLVEFEIDAGAHGLGISLHSEIYKLSEAERAQVTRIVIDQARGRVPVVVNTSAEGARLTVQYSHLAQSHGADALMIGPPTTMAGYSLQMRTFFRIVSDAVGLPIFVQDTDRAPVPPITVADVARTCLNVRYYIVESQPTPAKVLEATSQVGDELIVFGGAAGDYFIEEMRRGSRGTMPGCGQTKAFVRVWEHYRRGDERAAREVFAREIAPVNRFRLQTRAAFHVVDKEMLRHRGVIRSATTREPTMPLEEITRRELDEVLCELYGPAHA